MRLEAQLRTALLALAVARQALGNARGMGTGKMLEGRSSRACSAGDVRPRQRMDPGLLTTPSVQGPCAELLKLVKHNGGRRVMMTGPLHKAGLLQALIEQGYGSSSCHPLRNLGDAAEHCVNAYKVPARKQLIDGLPGSVLSCLCMEHRDKGWKWVVKGPRLQKKKYAGNRSALKIQV